MNTPGPHAENRIGDLQDLFEEALGVPFTHGNHIVRLKNGDEIFPAMLDAIAAAQRSVEFETFVYWSGQIAHRFADAIANAAARGVEVRVLLDAAGAKPMPQEVRQHLDRSSATVHDFGPLNPLRFWEIDHRTHRKLLVCDGEVAFTGGVGIAEQWEGDARDPDEWRESHFEIRGPAVLPLRASFVQHWLATVSDPEDLPGSLPRPSAEIRREWRHRQGPPSSETGAAIQVLRSTASGRWTDVQTLFRMLILSARERIRFTTAYFVPDAELIRLFCDACRRGVQVEIMHPGPHIDHRVSQLAGEAIYDELIEAGAEIFRYQRTMLHAKAVTVDGVLSCIGSSNLNYRSLQKDDEVSLVVLDRELTALLDEDFERDLEACEVLDDARHWGSRPWYQKSAERVARVFRGEL